LHEKPRDRLEVKQGIVSYKDVYEEDTKQRFYLICASYTVPVLKSFRSEWKVECLDGTRTAARTMTVMLLATPNVPYFPLFFLSLHPYATPYEHNLFGTERFRAPDVGSYLSTSLRRIFTVLLHVPPIQLKRSRESRMQHVHVFTASEVHLRTDLDITAGALLLAQWHFTTRALQYNSHLTTANISQFAWSAVHSRFPECSHSLPV
jgi:hypothetical protein